MAAVVSAPGGVVAATMTFVVYFNDAGIAGWVRDRARLVGKKHPSRIIVLDGTPAATPDTSANDEWMEIGASGYDAAALHRALATHALREAPIVLAWIAANVGSDERFTELAKCAQTVICSSSVIDTGSEAICALIDFAHAHPDIDVQDLAYLRLNAWQDLIADFFDDKRLLEDLFQLRNVEITAGSHAEAYYLLGWLASRLGWSACGKGQMCNRSQETITFTIHRAGGPRRVSRIALMTDSTTYLAEVLADEEDVARVEVTGAHAAPARVIPLHGLDIASLVGRAIVTHRDEVFHHTLAMTKQLIDTQC